MEAMQCYCCTYLVVAVLYAIPCYGESPLREGERSNFGAHRGDRAAVVLENRPARRDRIVLSHVVHPHPKSVEAVTFSPDGAFLLLGGKEGDVQSWDLTTRRKALQFETTGGTVSSLAFSPDGTTALGSFQSHPPSAEKWQGWVLVWDAETGAIRSRFESFANSVAVLPDSKHAAVACGWTNGGIVASPPSLEIRNLKSGRVTHQFPVKGAQVNTVAVSPDGRYLLSGTGDCMSDFAPNSREKDALVLWDVARTKRLYRWEIGMVDHAAFSADGRFALCVTNGQFVHPTINMIDIKTGKQTHVIDAHGPAVASFSVDGSKFLAARSTRISVTVLYRITLSSYLTSDANPISWWNLAQSRAIDRVEVAERVRCLAISRDAKFAVTVEGDNFRPGEEHRTLVKVWRLPN